MGWGGKRANSGQKPSGLVSRRVAVSLTPEMWSVIEKLKEEKHFASDAAIIREAMELSMSQFAAMLDQDQSSFRIKNGELHIQGEVVSDVGKKTDASKRGSQRGSRST